jgi:hypothetical protein
VVGYSEYSNGPLGYIKCGELADYVRNYQICKKNIAPRINVLSPTKCTLFKKPIYIYKVSSKHLKKTPKYVSASLKPSSGFF